MRSLLAWVLGLWVPFATSAAGKALALGLALWLVLGLPELAGVVCWARGRHALRRLPGTVEQDGFRSRVVVGCRRCRRRWYGTPAEAARALASGRP